MSRHLALAALDRLNATESLIDPALISTVQRNLSELASASAETQQAAYAERMDMLAQTYGYRGSLRDKPFVYANGVAVIPVHGTLLNRFNYSWGFATGYNFIRWQMNAALDDEDVQTIVLDVNSPGGEVSGCFELATDIRKARKTKPILAVVDALAASAAYALASAASKIYLTPTGKAGSVGVIAMHTDESKWLDDFGLKVSLIFAGKHKADGNPYEPLPEEVRKNIQASVDKAYGQFVDLVASNRSLDSQTIRDTEARVYRSDEALELGLVDAVKTPAEAVAAFLGELGDDSPAGQEDEDMSQIAAAPAAAAAPAIDQAALNSAIAAGIAAALPGAVTAAVSADRDRAASIRGSEEAKGREALAATLADQGMSVEQAAVILAAAPKAAAAAAGTTPNALAAAMAATPQPEVGADASLAAPGGEATSDDKAKAILGDFALATGRPLVKA